MRCAPYIKGQQVRDAVAAIVIRCHSINSEWFDEVYDYLNSQEVTGENRQQFLEHAKNTKARLEHTPIQ